MKNIKTILMLFAFVLLLGAGNANARIDGD